MIRVIFITVLCLSGIMISAQVSLTTLQTFFKNNPSHYSDGFDFPIGKPDAKNYYNAQPFGKNTHLGDDWNGKGGGNTDLGDPVFSCANGYVVFAQNIGGGWGNVVRVVHVTSENPLVLVESIYAHLNEIKVKEGPIKRGEQLGTIGNNGGMYYAHLHLEIRTEYNMGIGGGYSSITTGYTDPTAFIRLHRPKND